MDPSTQPSALHEKRRSPVREVFWSGRYLLTGHADLDPTRSSRQADVVAEIHDLHHRFDLMVSIGPAGDHLEKEIDLRRRGNVNFVHRMPS
jgi:hypothetical protein